MAELPRSALLITPRWTRDGGVGAHVQASAGALAAAGVRVGVLVARVEPDADTASPVTVFACPELFDKTLAPERRLGEAAAFPAEVIHLHQVDDPRLVRDLRKRAPVLLSAHAYTACTAGVHYFRPGQECDRAHGPGCWTNLLARGCAHTRRPHVLPAAYGRARDGLTALREADLAVCYSSAVERHLLVNSVTRQALVPLFATVASHSDCPRSAHRRVLFAGRVVAPKGIAVLIQAMRELDGELVVCGTGWRLEAARRLSERLDLQERVRFAGWASPKQLAREIADAAVVALPSLWPEPFGLIGIEALAAGRPVVASAGGGVGDWLHDGVNGLAVPAGDAPALARALRLLLDDPGTRERMGRAGRSTVAARFTARHHVEGLAQAYARARANWSSTASTLQPIPIR